MAARPKSVDWRGIRAAYEAGTTSQRSVAKNGGITLRALQKRAEKEGWERRLAPQIRHRAAEKIAQVTTAGAEKTDEHDIVEANAELIKQVVLAHRDDLKIARELVASMMLELKAKALNHAALEAFCEVAASIEAEGLDGAKKSQRFDEAMDAFGKLVRLPSRALSLQRLMQSLAILQDKERIAFGADDSDRGARGAHDPATTITIPLSRLPGLLGVITGGAGGGTGARAGEGRPLLPYTVPAEATAA